MRWTQISNPSIGCNGSTWATDELDRRMNACDGRRDEGSLSTGCEDGRGEHRGQHCVGVATKELCMMWHAEHLKEQIVAFGVGEEIAAAQRVDELCTE